MFCLYTTSDFYWCHYIIMRKSRWRWFLTGSGLGLLGVNKHTLLENQVFVMSQRAAVVSSEDIQQFHIYHAVNRGLNKLKEHKTVCCFFFFFS